MNFVILPHWLQRGNAVKFSLCKEATTHLTYIECTDVSSLAQHATDYFFFNAKKKLNTTCFAWECAGTKGSCAQECCTRIQMGTREQHVHLFCLNTLPRIAHP